MLSVLNQLAFLCYNVQLNYHFIYIRGYIYYPLHTATCIACTKILFSLVGICQDVPVALQIQLQELCPEHPSPIFPHGRDQNMNRERAIVCR